MTPERDTLFKCLRVSLWGKEAADEAGVGIRIVEERHAAMDHPVHLSVPETEYLKFYILQIV